LEFDVFESRIQKQLDASTKINPLEVGFFEAKKG
jgi:hypothetical protein